MEKALYEQVFIYMESKKNEMISVLESVVNIESFMDDPSGVAKVANKFKKLFEAEGFQCELAETPPNGPTLIGILGEERQAKPILFSGHMDTVVKPGAYPSPVFRIENGNAYGPGVLDMKGGIVIALYVAKALNSIGYTKRPLKIVFSGDEESGHSGSNGAQIMEQAASGAVCAFNMETGLVDNSLCYGRKGRVEAQVTVNGVESHAGNDFLGGVNAIAEMAHKIIGIQDLTDLERGTTVTCAKIEGGTVSNAIPKQCVMNVECRFETEQEMERFKASLETICTASYITGTTTDIRYTDNFPPFESSEQVMHLWTFIKTTAKECGLEEVLGKKLGGASDAAYIQKSGTPVICSIGIQGQWNHTTREYAVLDSLVSRGKLVSAAILNLENL
ncbi:MAG: M20 family metallopeptidase [Synergistaceae bacterium]|nr:M20 family metallopeptidase [Synergistaceae bacterium]MBP9626679.1 M20 family metallopeptidase [Synergistaceae bacterium]